MRGGTNQLIGFHFLENRDRVLVQFGNIQSPELPRFSAQENILRHSSFGKQVEFLVDDTDALLAGLPAGDE